MQLRKHKSPVFIPFPNPKTHIFVDKMFNKEAILQFTVAPSLFSMEEN